MYQPTANEIRTARRLARLYLGKGESYAYAWGEIHAWAELAESRGQLRRSLRQAFGHIQNMRARCGAIHHWGKAA